MRTLQSLGGEEKHKKFPKRLDSEDWMYLRKAEDFHRPNLMISWSEKPRLAAWVAAPILREWVL